MFKDILGNEVIQEMLEKSLKNNTFSHSYLLIGTQGIGKKMIAMEFAKGILNPNAQNEINCNNHPDFLCVGPQDGSVKIEQIRFLQKKIQEKPIISSRKVYIIDDADTMTTEAQNCLLKTLEEPPEFATIILIGTNENNFLPTIKSRCMILRFQPIEDEQIKKYMKENYGMNNLTQNQLALFQGSIGKAILLKDKQDKYLQIENMVQSLNQKDLLSILKLAEPLYESKEDIFEILEYMNIILLNHARENYLYTDCIKIVEETKKRLRQNANYDMCIDNLMFNMWEKFV